jgi:5-methylcytosine-specific restriction enzyme B
VGSGERLGFVRTVTFHPAYGYEDFLEGYLPVLRSGQMAFEPHQGVFKALCRDAEEHPDARFFLVIDEINRGDVPRIFGELLTILEKDKRGQSVLLGTSGEPFRVPGNVFVLGTMNTADRSVALLDAALRRRFGFIELMPDASVLGGASVGGIPLGRWLDALNARIREHAGRDARNLQIGHSYLLEAGKPIEQLSRFAEVLRDELVPLLEEYAYEDYPTLGKILGPGLVDMQHQRIRDEVFDPAHHDALIQHLLELNPELTTTPEAVSSEASAPAPEPTVDSGEDAGSAPDA